MFQRILSVHCVFTAVFIQSLSAFAIDTPNGCKMGSEWTKRDFTPADLSDSQSSRSKILNSIAQFGSGTSFYLGKFNKHHLMATNFHVAHDTDCILFENSPGLHPIPTTADFPVLGFSANCVRYLGDKKARGWNEIDFAIYEITLTPEQETRLKGVGLKPAWNKPLQQGDLLITAGYGIAGNYKSHLQFTEDSDCKVFSATGDFRKKADPDPTNPEPYQAWSFANGCDGSHGDSGSPYLNRQTGEWVGLLWTGTLPKTPEVQNSVQLEQMIVDQNPKIWTELNYGVPLAKIQEKMNLLLKEGSLSADDQATIKAWLNGENTN